MRCCGRWDFVFQRRWEKQITAPAPRWPNTAGATTDDARADFAAGKDSGKAVTLDKCG